LCCDIIVLVVTAAYEAVGDKDAWKNPKYRDAIREKEATLEE